MKKLLFAAILTIITSCQADKTVKRQLPILNEENPAETTYYLIRHAEKLRDNPENKNPQLDTIGFKRGEFWGEYFQDKNLDMFFTTDYLRTFQTLFQ